MTDQPTAGDYAPTVDEGMRMGLSRSQSVALRYAVESKVRDAERAARKQALEACAKEFDPQPYLLLTCRDIAARIRALMEKEQDDG